MNLVGRLICICITFRIHISLNAISFWTHTRNIKAFFKNSILKAWFWLLEVPDLQNQENQLNGLIRSTGQALGKFN